MSNRIIKRPGWFFVVEVCGNDLVVRNTTATWFGGDRDPNDNGQTACGYPTKGHPDLLACSLPMDYQGRDAATRKAVGGSPLPMLPWGLKRDGTPNPSGTRVIVTCGEISQTLPLIDIGPAKWAGDGIDLTVAAFRAFKHNLKEGVISVSYRIPNAAQYVA